MGLEANCTVRRGRKQSDGKARLEEKDIEFRGDFRLDIPFAEITSAEAKRGVLRIVHSGGVAEFDLGAAAEKWALKIRYPKPLIDKIGIKPRMRVLVAGKHDGVGAESFWRELHARAQIVKRGQDLDCILFFAAVTAELEQLRALRKLIRLDGMIWAIYPKGVQVIREAEVMAAAKQHGLVDVKNVSFSETHSGLKLMIPVGKR